MRNEILDMIISLLKGVKGNNYIVDGDVKLWNNRYLLNQVIRQYAQPEDHHFVSEKALEAWNKITSESIYDKTYHDKIKLDRADGSIALKCYKGNSNSFSEWIPNKNDTLTFRDAFHDEHIVPIKMIIEELGSLPSPDYESIKKVLDKIRICKMLKEEDKRIINRSNRSLDFRLAIKENYTPVGIVCINVAIGERL